MCSLLCLGSTLQTFCAHLWNFLLNWNLQSGMWDITQCRLMNTLEICCLVGTGCRKRCSSTDAWFSWVHARKFVKFGRPASELCWGASLSAWNQFDLYSITAFAKLCSSCVIWKAVCLTLNPTVESWPMKSVGVMAGRLHFSLQSFRDELYSSYYLFFWWVFVRSFMLRE